MKPKSISNLSWIKAYLIHLKARTLCPWCAFVIICDLKQTGKVQLKRAVEQAAEVISRFFKELSSKVTSCSKRCYTFFSTISSVTQHTNYPTERTTNHSSKHTFKRYTVTRRGNCYRRQKWRLQETEWKVTKFLRAEVVLK